MPGQVWAKGTGKPYWCGSIACTTLSPNANTPSGSSFRGRIFNLNPLIANPKPSAMNLPEGGYDELWIIPSLDTGTMSSRPIHTYMALTDHPIYTDQHNVAVFHPTDTDLHNVAVFHLAHGLQVEDPAVNDLWTRKSAGA